MNTAAEFLVLSLVPLFPWIRALADEAARAYRRAHREHRINF